MSICKPWESWTVIPHTDEISDLGTFDPTQLCLWWSLKLETNETRESIEDNMTFFLDNQNIQIEEVEGPPIETIAKAALNEPDEAMPTNNLLKPSLKAPLIQSKEQVSSSLPQIKQLPPPKSPSSKSPSSIRVSINKLDNLVSLVGECILQQSRLHEFHEQVASLNKKLSIDFNKIVRDGDRTINELRAQVMDLRMVPIGGLFSPLQRTVRDYSKQSGKQIILIIQGEETELDKTVIEQINGPLNHLLRNSMDHGIEPPDVREQNGKSIEGTITLNAYHHEGYIVIEIKDDGGGINKERVLTIAKEKGLVDESNEMSEQEIFQLIFQPGFSTAETVTDISGRGVGLDAVRRNIEALSGTIKIDSVEGQGTTTTLQLPLTLTIIDGLLVKVSNNQFIMPLVGIEECIELFRRVENEIEDQRVFKLRNEAVPYISLRELFGLKGDTPDIEHLVIVTIQQKRVGFVVDQIVGEFRTVMKSLGRIYRDLKEYSGATTLGDGTVVLILDLNQLLKKVSDAKRKSNNSKAYLEDLA